jgi:hypothetical protein
MDDIERVERFRQRATKIVAKACSEYTPAGEGLMNDDDADLSLAENEVVIEAVEQLVNLLYAFPTDPKR